MARPRRVSFYEKLRSRTDPSSAAHNARAPSRAREQTGTHSLRAGQKERAILLHGSRYTEEAQSGLIKVVCDFDQIAVRVADVNRPNRTGRTRTVHRTLFDVHVFVGQVRHDGLQRSGGDEA